MTYSEAGECDFLFSRNGVREEPHEGVLIFLIFRLVSVSNRCRKKLCNYSDMKVILVTVIVDCAVHMSLFHCIRSIERAKETAVIFRRYPLYIRASNSRTT